MITTENTRIPEWVQKGKMRWVWGLWEPLMFYRRNASQNATAVGNALWSEAYYRRMHSEEIVAQLAEAGVNCISTHYFKGFGLKAEAHEMDLAAELTERYHKYGIRVFGYHQYGTLAYETLKEEVPDLEDWAMRNEDGSIYCYGADRHTGRGGLYWRWMACSTSDAHADYLKRVIRKCLTGAGMDGIEWDGTVYRCYCERCQQRFKAYLQERYPDPWRDFGLRNFDHTRIPEGRRSVDPLYQEWTVFRDKILRDRLREYYLFVKEIKPDAAVVMYPSWPNAEPRPDHQDIIVDESHDLPHIDRGTLTTRMPHCKRANASGVIAFNTAWMRRPGGGLRTVETAEEVALDMAESGAYGGQIVTATWALRSAGPGDRAVFEKPGIHEAFRRYMGYYRDHEFLYEVVRPLANVGIYWSYHSSAFAGSEASQEAWMQSLIQNQIPFEVILSDRPGDLGRFDVIVLADQACLNNAECDLFRTFVEEGKGLVITGRTSRYDERFRQRMAPGLASILDHERVIYMPDILDNEKQAGRVGPVHPWLPSCHQTLASSVARVSPRGLPLRVYATPFVTVDIYEVKSGAKVVHLINYENGRPVKNVKVELGGGFEGVRDARLYSPDDGSEGVALALGEESGRSVFVVPHIQTYAAVELR